MKEEAHITYNDENNERQEGWFELVEINQGYITFLTGKNRITIPINRVLRVKQRGGDTE